jgi:hypothetical protein
MPTAQNPLSGFEGFSGLESTVVGHPKQNMKPMPVLEVYPHKVLFSTGAVTMPNYTDSKAGKKGEFHHTFGFLVVEKKNEDNFHIRNVVADDTGEFNDLIYNVKGGKVSYAKPVEALVLGDLHSGSEDIALANETTKLFSILKPKKIVLHDVFDATSVSHHNEKDPFYKYQLHLEGKDKVKKELDYMNSVLRDISEYGETYVVRANHDEHLDKYLKERDWKKDLTNAEEYMELSLALLKGKAPKGALPYVIEKENPQVKCLDVDESLNIKGVECGLHGDRGANGSRG